MKVNNTTIIAIEMEAIDWVRVVACIDGGYRQFYEDKERFESLGGSGAAYILEGNLKKLDELRSVINNKLLAPDSGAE